MNIADELQKLANLRKEGNLTDGEFADAKRRLLAREGEEGEGPPPENEGDRAATAGPIDEERYQSSRWSTRSEEHTSELQSLRHLVCRLLLEKKKQEPPLYRSAGRPPHPQPSSHCPPGA